MRRPSLSSLLVVLVCIPLLSFCALRTGQAQSDISERARKIHREATVVDTHVDTLQRVLIGDVDISKRTPDGHIDIPRMREGGMKAEFFSVWVDSVFEGPTAVKRTLDLIDAMNRVIANSPKDLQLAVNASDIERANKEGKIAALMGIEGGHAIDDDLAALRLYRQLGVSYMTLTWSNPTSWADSSGNKNRDHVKAPDGLNDFGRQVVREMNRIGMIVDISHVSDKTFYDVIATTSKPVIASHSSCRALCDVPRNMTDDMLRAVAKNGGVVGINFNSGFIEKAFNARTAEYEKQHQGPVINHKDYIGNPEAEAAANYKLDYGQPSPVDPPTFDMLMAHIEHAIKIAGIDHVGIGSDFDGVPSLPKGMEDVTKLPRITEALLQKGYSEQDIKKVLGGNFMRVIREVTGK